MEALSTGILSLDYALGIGGYPCGHITGVFGPPDIGKSSTLGLSAIRSAQLLGQNGAWISTEHKFDKKWAAQLGVDTDKLLLVYPDSGEAAFDALYTIVASGAVKVCVFDSIGALLNKSEIDGTDNKDAKMKMGGRANLITWGTHRILSVMRKNKVVVLYLNQQRQIMSATSMGGFQQPGGEAVKHNEVVIIQLKNGDYKARVEYTDENGDKVEIGREVVAHILRNQVAEGSKHTAPFMFFNKQVDGFPFGVDEATDFINTGKRVGVVTGTSWIEVEGIDKKFNGKKPFREFLEANPEEKERLRKLILERAQEQRRGKA